MVKVNQSNAKINKQIITDEYHEAQPPPNTGSVENLPNSGLSNWEKIVGLILGVALIITLIVLVVLIPKPTEIQLLVFKWVMALSSAGVAGIFSGMIHVEGKIKQFAIRAGGALAVFVVVYFFNPALPGEYPGVENNRVINADDGADIIKHSDSGDTVIETVPSNDVEQ